MSEDSNDQFDSNKGRRVRVMIAAQRKMSARNPNAPCRSRLTVRTEMPFSEQRVATGPCAVPLLTPSLYHWCGCGPIPLLGE